MFARMHSVVCVVVSSLIVRNVPLAQIRTSRDDYTSFWWGKSLGHGMITVYPDSADRARNPNLLAASCPLLHVQAQRQPRDERPFTC